VLATDGLDFSSLLEKENKYIIIKNSSLQNAGELMKFKNIYVQWGLDPVANRVKIKSLHYPKEKYTRYRVETILKEIIDCPHCEIGHRVAVSARTDQDKNGGQLSSNKDRGKNTGIQTEEETLSRTLSLTKPLDKPVGWLTKTTTRRKSANTTFNSTIAGSLFLSKILQLPVDMLTAGLGKKAAKIAGGLILLSYVGWGTRVPLVKKFRSGSRLQNELKVIGLDMLATGIADPTPEDVSAIQHQLDVWRGSGSFSNPIDSAKNLLSSFVRSNNASPAGTNFAGVGTSVRRLLGPGFRGRNFGRPVDTGLIKSVTTTGRGSTYGSIFGSQKGINAPPVEKAPIGGLTVIGDR
jgi:hypothetical protein